VNHKTLEELTRRKQALIIRAADERAQIAATCGEIRASLDFSQKFSWIARTLRTHPLVAAGISSVLVGGLAGKLVRGAGRAVALSRLVLPLWSWLNSRRKAP
jgi:hypothetical protein